MKVDPDSIHPSQHRDGCDQPGMVWQAQIGDWPRRGYCANCGAVEVHRPAAAPEPEPRRIRTRTAR